MTTSFVPVTCIEQLPEPAQHAIVNLWNAFWPQVDIRDPDACWLWKGKIGSLGYGLFNHAGFSTHAYRIAWMLLNPSFPTGNGSLIRHTCSNPRCCNPNHLRIGTHKENAQDRIEAGTQLRGSESHLSKLTESIVYNILCEHARDDVPPTILAEKYGVYYGTVSNILERKTWTHVPLPPDWKGFRTARQLGKARDRKGEKVERSRYTAEQVYQMRVDFLEGKTATDISKSFGVCPTTIPLILKGRTWKHVPFPPEWTSYDEIKECNLAAWRLRKGYKTNCNKN